MLISCISRPSISCMNNPLVSTQNVRTGNLGDFLSLKTYERPSWASSLTSAPIESFSLGRFPTPIHQWNLPYNLPKGTEVWIKREDLSGMQLSGNKPRKLEFLMADAMKEGADCIVTTGALQSNSCRAAAVAANYSNLDSYLILFTFDAVDKDPGFVGNLLVTRLVGAHIDLISVTDYAQIGEEVLMNSLKEKLLKEGRRPYLIPAGASNPLGTWGYIEAVREIEQQLQQSSNKQKFDDIVVSCGSGGTVAGLAVGSSLSNLKARVTGFSISNDPDYYYDHIQGLFDGINAGVRARDMLTIIDAKGNGYDQTTPEELEFIEKISETTGIVLDHVYTGKAAYGMMKDMDENPSKWEGRKVLFIHTGGLMGLYAVTDQLQQPEVEPTGGQLGLYDRLARAGRKWRTMPLDDSMPRHPGIGKMV